MSLFAQRDHAHLRLAAALSPQPRRKLSPGGGSRGPTKDHGTHAERIRDQVETILERHRHRTTVFGISPDLVVVVEFRVPAVSLADQLEQAGLQVLAAIGMKAMAAFATDPEMAEFLHHTEQYSQGTPPDQKSAHYERLFDAIDKIRPLEPADVVDNDVQLAIPEVQQLRLDIQCWCPDDEPEARRRFDETLRAVSVAGGTVLDKSFRYNTGLSLIRAEVPADTVWQLAEVDRIREIRLLPAPLFTVPEMTTAGIDDLPRTLAPKMNAPVVAVIDSGVCSSHPLLAQAIAEAVPGADHIADGSDEHGHGTLVASLALYGSLERHLRSREPLTPAGRLLSIRLLDHNAEFSGDKLWESQLRQAIELAAANGARVINLSLGDSRHPYQPPGPVPVAAMVDLLARTHDLVVVISAGNFASVDYPADPEISSNYLTWLLQHDYAGLLSPAMSALALTVGALVGDAAQGARPTQESVDQRLIGKPSSPSPATRTGPGIENMVKPDLAAPGGTYSYDLGLHQVRQSPDGTVVGAGGKDPTKLLARDVGTSFAAPLVSHAALRVLSRYPALTACAVRAILLATAQPLDPVTQGTPAEQRNSRLQLSGYGRVSAERAELSTDHRAVLVAEDKVLPDQVNFYTVQIPDAFFTNGYKSVGIGLAFDPEVRATRFTYLSHRMSVYVYRGVTVETVRAKFAVHPDDGEPEDLATFKLGDLQPSDKTRKSGANQAAFQTWPRAWGRKYQGERLVIVVRSTNRWAPTDELQRYALAVVLETDESMPELYGQLRAELEVLAEVETEVELE